MEPPHRADALEILKQCRAWLLIIIDFKSKPISSRDHKRLLEALITKTINYMGKNAQFSADVRAECHLLQSIKSTAEDKRSLQSFARCTWLNLTFLIAPRSDHKSNIPKNLRNAFNFFSILFRILEAPKIVCANLFELTDISGRSALISLHCKFPEKVSVEIEISKESNRKIKPRRI